MGYKPWRNDCNAQRRRKKGLSKRPSVNGSKRDGHSTTRDKQNVNLIHENRIVLSTQEKRLVGGTLNTLDTIEVRKNIYARQKRPHSELIS
ncbi:transporter [Apiospora arundinis]